MKARLITLLSLIMAMALFVPSGPQSVVLAKNISLVTDSATTATMLARFPAAHAQESDDGLIAYGGSDGNVWLANTDEGEMCQITLDGDWSANWYDSVSHVDRHRSLENRANILSPVTPCWHPDSAVPGRYVQVSQHPNLCSPLSANRILGIEYWLPFSLVPDTTCYWHTKAYAVDWNRALSATNGFTITLPAEIAYEDGGRIWIIKEDGSDRRQITESGVDCCPAWSPDGTWLYFIRNLQGTGAIVKYDVAGREERLIGPLGKSARGPVAVAPDGKLVAFVYDYEPVTPHPVFVYEACLSVLNVESGTYSDLDCIPGNLDRPSFSPDGTQLAVGYLGFEMSVILLFTLDSSGYTVVECNCSPESECYCRSPDFFPDGHSLATVVWFYFPDRPQPEGIYRMDLDNGDMTPLVVGADRPSAPDVSEDGTRLLYERHERIEILDLSTGQTRVVTAGHAPVWRPPVRGPSISDLLTRKRAVLARLEQTSVEILGLPFPVDAYDETAAHELIQYLQTDAVRSSLSPDQVDAFARLTVQEEGLAELLPLYSQTSADLTEVGADVVGILLSLGREADRALEACYTSGNPFSGACETLNRLIDRQILRIINSLVRLAIRFIPDPHQQEELRDFWMRLIDSIMLRLDAGDTVQDILLSTVVKGPAVSLLVRHYVGAVQPSLDQGVRSADPAYAGSEPTWSVEGQLEPAELHVEGIVEQATIRTEHAHSVHQDLMRGADVAQLLTDIADLGRLSPLTVLARIAAYAGRVEHLFVDVTAMVLNYNSMFCTQYLSTRAGSLAFNPNQPGENCEYIGDSSFSAPRMARELAGGGNAAAWEPVWSHAASDMDAYEEAVANLLAAMRGGNAEAIVEALTVLDEADQALGSSTDQAMSVILNSDVPDSEAMGVLSQSNRFSLDALELYLLVASYVTAPEDEHLMVEVEQAASDVLSSSGQYSESLQAAAPTGTEDRALPVIRTIILPDEVVVEQPFDVTVVVQNVGSADASAVEVRAQGTGQEVQVTEIGTLGTDQTYTATLQTQSTHTGTLTLLVEVGMGGSVTDSRVNQMRVELESPEEKEIGPEPQPGCCRGLGGLVALPMLMAVMLARRRLSSSV